MIEWLVVAALSAAAPPQGGGDLLVSLSGENRVVLVDSATGQAVATFPGVAGPHEITLSRDRRTAYVVNAGAGPNGPAGKALTAIDPAARSARQLPLSHEMPHDVRVSRDGRLLWVAVAPSRAVIEVDATTGTLVRTFGMERDGGWFVAATPDDRKLYVPHLEGKGLTAIDRATGTSRAVLSGTAFSGAEVSPDGGEVWAIEHEARRIHILATSTDRAVGTIALDAPDFGRLQFSPDGTRVVVVQGTRLLSFDVATRRKAAEVEMPLAGKVIAVAPTGRRAAISNPDDGRVTIVDLGRMQVVSTFAVGKAPDGVAWVK